MGDGTDRANERHDTAPGSDPRPDDLEEAGHGSGPQPRTASGSDPLPNHPEEADRGPAPIAIRPAESEPGAGNGRVRPSPIGRRVAVGAAGLVGLAAAGLLFGRRLMGRWGTATQPTETPDGQPQSTGRFRIYSVTRRDPEVSTATWRLRVTGLVDRPLDLGWDDLMGYPQVAVTKDFQCVTGWRVTNVPWQGVLLRSVLDAAGVRPGATALTFRSLDGVYTESLTLEQAQRDDMLVAHHLFGRVVPPVQGGPVRLYTGPMYGYKSLKWLGEIVVTDRVEPGYWEVRGYDIDAWVGQSNRRRDRPIE